MPKGVYDRSTSKARKKGKWSKLARAKHSARMKERYKQRALEAGTTNGAHPLSKNSISARLDAIILEAQTIKRQLGS